MTLTIAMPCGRCQERGQTWHDSPPTCAFLSGTFSEDNWNCATMNTLRDLAGNVYDDEHQEVGALCWRDDMAAGSFGALYVPETPHFGGFYICWYKSRGRTGQAWVMDDNDEPHPLTILEATEAIDAIQAWRRAQKASSES